MKPLRTRATVLAALTVAVSSFLLYHATLLPGFDLGDTPSFQVMSGEAIITPRDGYPLYFALGKLFVFLDGDRAHAMNLASAAAAAVACGLIVLLAVELSGSLVAGIASALLFAGSYTFWSQAVIAEVYALHVLLIVLVMLLLLRWSHQPTARNLACFYLVYALSFGNHLTMILLAPALAFFLVAAAPNGPRVLLEPRLLLLAVACAAVGASQYAWNLRALWLQSTPPPDWLTAMQSFWFDATKSDWRDNMVLRIPPDAYGERLRMYAFDLRQQFGWAGPLVAACGAWRLFRTAPKRAWLLVGIFLANLVFALGYNVGDTHVFLLPSHLILALFAAPGLVLLGRFMPPRAGVAVFAVLLIGAGIYRDFPALNRSGDQRPTELLSALTTGLDDRQSVLIAELNWQVQNGLTYFEKEVRKNLAVARLSDVALYAPALVADNLAIQRDVLLTESARSTLDRAYGPLFEIAPDSRTSATTMAELVGTLPADTRYALTVLRPVREFTLDLDDLRGALLRLDRRTSRCHWGW